MGSISEILPDLLAIEVNTIIKDDMTAQRMPSLPHALLDIIQDYASKLEDYAVDLNPFFGMSVEDIKEGIREEKGLQTAEVNLDDYDDLARVFNNSLLKRHGQGSACFDLGSIRNGWISFEILRLISILVHDDEREFKPTPAQKCILVRIRRNCDQLKYIVNSLQLGRSRGLTGGGLISRGFARLKDFFRSGEDIADWSEVLDKNRRELLRDELRTKRLPLASVDLNDLTCIRKAWEISTESVLAQTTIQIDGDVVTRISRDFLSGEFSKQREVILLGHRQSLDVCIAHWQGLVKIALDLAGSIMGARKGRVREKS